MAKVHVSKLRPKSSSKTRFVLAYFKTSVTEEIILYAFSKTGEKDYLRRLPLQGPDDWSQKQKHFWPTPNAVTACGAVVIDTWEE